MDGHELDEIEARALASTEGIIVRPRGEAKYYGVELDALGWPNPIRIMGTQEEEYPEGDAAHSEREPEDPYSHWPLGGHYESKRDLANALFFASARNDVLKLVVALREGKRE